MTRVLVLCSVLVTSACGRDAAQPTAPVASESAAATASSAPASEPKIAQGQVTVSGRLPPEVVQRVVRDGFGRIRSCYAEAFRKNPKLEGRVIVKYVIGRDGAVTDARDHGSDLPDANVVACIVEAFRAFSYPQPEGGIVVVEWPMFYNTVP